jgi:signal transduction histidine kinase
VVLFGAMGVITRALRESQNLVQRQQNFIASVTHELRTPLTSLKLSADTLALRAPDKEASLRLAERMSDDVERLDQMVSQLLESARIEAKATRADPTAVNLYPLLQAEVHALHCRLAPHGVLLQLDCPPELHVSARPMDLKMVITNLLSNAVKSCEVAGGGAVHVAVTAEGRHAKIQFSDDGVGFDPAEADRIFERFYRPGDELRRETIGSGLGLYIVKEISRAHGGSIDAESSGPGQGATLTLTWPTADTPPSA